MNYEDLVAGLKKLRLPNMMEQFQNIARDSENNSDSFEKFLATLVKIEVEARHANKVTRLINAAKIPRKKLINEYDFARVSGVNEKQIQRLVSGQFLSDSGNVTLYGDIGVGKSHLAEAIALELCQKGHPCYFTTAHSLITKLIEAQHALKLAAEFRKLDRFDLIVIDELGYTDHPKEGANLFFELISQRYERKSLIFTTNLPYSDWHKVFGHELNTRAAVDRVIHRCQTFNIEGPSWRAEEAAKRQQVTED